MIGNDIIILILGAVTVYLLVLWTHSMRFKVGLAPFYALIGAITAVMSWMTDAGIQLQAAGITFMVGSTVFYTALLLGVFVVYVFDGPQPTRVAIFTVAGISIFMPLVAALTHAQTSLSHPSSLPMIPLPSLRINAASVLTTMADLLFLAVAWEFLGTPNFKVKIFLRAFLTLLGVMWLDVILFSAGAFAGTPQYLSIMEGTLLSRFVISVFACPFLYFYIQWQNVKMGATITHRPVLAILSEVAEVRAELGLAQKEIERRKMAERALKENEERYSTFIDSSDDMAFLKDGNSRYLFVNRAFADFCGKLPEEMVGRDDSEIMNGEFAEILSLNEDICFAEKPVSVKDIHIKDRIYETRQFVVKLGESRFGQGAYIRDVSLSRNADKELQSSYHRLNQIMEFLPDPTVVIDQSGRITFWNRAMTDLTGINSDQIVGKSDYEYALPFYGQRRPMMLDLVMNCDEKTVSGYHNLRREGGRLISETYLPNFRERGPMWLSNIAAPLYDHENRIIGAIEAIRDISQLKNSEKMLLQTEKYKAVADLAAGVAHNFNNFLQIILGNTNICLMRLRSGNLTNIEKNLSTIVDTCGKGAETVQRLNQFASYSESENRESRVETFDLSLVAKEAAELTKPFWYSSSVKSGMKIDLIANTVPGRLVEGVKSQITEVLVNLIKNAVEAMPQGGTIEVETSYEPDWAVLKVKDTGSGIPNERMGNLFNPFFTSNLELGRGLGLATALKIIEDHHGEITVESAVGVGSAFTVRLPAIKRSANEQGLNGRAI